ncbi:MAG: deoxyribonuclease V [Chloroflexota bacterium]|nr:deoxyribonuclease V [Chloroflexota bacterium]MDE2941076.1 deoxyribonuclease V [Chloroflexota bacterium]MDE3267398.1 deoxyribonuclease V [Chloroflexota bacterium]
MNIQSLHPWDVDARTAADIQRELAARVVVRDEVTPEPRFVAGVDLSPPDANGEATAAAVVMELPSLSIVEVRLHRGVPAFPYVPGLLSFREAPLVLGALAKLSTPPDAILVDGHGMAHPRRFGLACHIGLLTGIPTVGCAKSILCGRPDGSLKPERGSHVPLVDRGEVIGAAVRTRDSVSPIYVSVGHRVSLERAVELTLAGCWRYRMPEPTRLAHLAAAGRIEPVGAGA